jgi:hypothetical protein
MMMEGSTSAYNFEAVSRKSSTAEAANLIASTDHDMCPSQKPAHCGRVGVEETFLCFWNTIATPVDLHELWKFTLQIEYQ